MGHWGPVFWTFDHQLVVEGSTGAPKGTAWALRVDFFDLGNLLGVEFDESSYFFLV